jgi:glycerophosphoryl diester phosphodiesterase
MTHLNPGLLTAPGRVLAIAHRGGSKLRPENTLMAFDHAVTLGVDAFECDVHLSSDGEVVLIHDDTLDRTTDASGRVSDRTASELSRIDAGFRFGEADGFPWRGRGIGVPRLADLLERHRHMPVIVEIKGDNPEVADRTVDVVRKMEAVDRVVVAGFSQVVLDRVRATAPEIVTSGSRDEVRSAVRWSRVGLLPPGRSWQVLQAPMRLGDRTVVDARLLGAARRARLSVQVWIVDDPAEMRWLIEHGAQGLISDRPDLAVAAARNGSRPFTS